MFVLSGNANGGFHGPWPGLAPEQLFDSADLDVQTDFRRVLSEILVCRMGNNQLGFVFPGYSGYSPLGVVSGVDLPTEGLLLTDSFEGGEPNLWSAVID